MVKDRKSTTTQTVLAHQRLEPLVGPDTHRGEIAGKPNHDTAPRARLCLPPCVAMYNSHSARMPCAPQPLPSHPVSTVSSAAALPLLAAACLICCDCSLVQTKNYEVARRHPGGLGTEQTLSPLVRVLVSFEHEAGSFYTNHQNSYTVAT